MQNLGIQSLDLRRNLDTKSPNLHKNIGSQSLDQSRNLSTKNPNLHRNGGIQDQYKILLTIACPFFNYIFHPNHCISPFSTYIFITVILCFISIVNFILIPACFIAAITYLISVIACFIIVITRGMSQSQMSRSLRCRMRKLCSLKFIPVLTLSLSFPFCSNHFLTRALEQVRRRLVN